MEPSYLFVYGTLRRGSKNKFARLLHARAQFAGKARIRGRLYRLGAYPGAVCSNQTDEWIRGELYYLHDPHWILPPLDLYEGPEFRRVKMEALRDSNERLEAFAYLWRGTPSGIRIPGGDWLKR